jgi:diguanylate cyclase (GGDEF)-like protein
VHSRDRAPRRGADRFWKHIGGVAAAGFVLLGVEAARLSGSDFGAAGWPLVVLAGLALVSELRPLVTAGSPDDNGVTLSTTFVFALLLSRGLALALVLQAVATVLADAVRHKAVWRTAFNIAQYSLSWGAAAVVLWLAGAGATPTDPLALTVAQLPAVVGAAVVYFAVNNLLVSRAVALHEHSPLRRELGGDLGYRLLSDGSLLTLAPVVVLLVDRSTWFVSMLVLPLMALYVASKVSVDKEKEADHDALTGLANRSLLHRRTADAIRAGRRSSDVTALLVLDLDGFKQINDELGHQVGDELLRVVSRRLTSGVRAEDTVARFGGDEFAVLLPVVGSGAAHKFAVRLWQSLDCPVTHEGRTLRVRASIGVATCPQDGDGFDSLLRSADVAMYLAKERSCGVVVAHEIAAAAPEMRAAGGTTAQADPAA